MLFAKEASFSAAWKKKDQQLHRTSCTSATTKNRCVPLAQPHYEPQGTILQTLDLAAKELQRSFSHLIGESLGTFGMSLDSFGSLGSFPHLCGKSLDMLELHFSAASCPWPLGVPDEQPTPP